MASLGAIAPPPPPPPGGGPHKYGGPPSALDIPSDSEYDSGSDDSGSAPATTTKPKRVRGPRKNPLVLSTKAAADKKVRDQGTAKSKRDVERTVREDLAQFVARVAPRKHQVEAANRGEPVTYPAGQLMRAVLRWGEAGFPRRVGEEEEGAAKGGRKRGREEEQEEEQDAQYSRRRVRPSSSSAARSQQDTRFSEPQTRAANPTALFPRPVQAQELVISEIPERATSRAFPSASPAVRYSNHALYVHHNMQPPNPQTNATNIAANDLARDLHNAHARLQILLDGIVTAGGLGRQTDRPLLNDFNQVAQGMNALQAQMADLIARHQHRLPEMQRAARMVQEEMGPEVSGQEQTEDGGDGEAVDDALGELESMASENQPQSRRRRNTKNSRRSRGSRGSGDESVVTGLQISSRYSTARHLLHDR